MQKVESYAKDMATKYANITNNTNAQNNNRKKVEQLKDSNLQLKNVSKKNGALKCSNFQFWNVENNSAAKS